MKVQKRHVKHKKYRRGTCRATVTQQGGEERKKLNIFLQYLIKKVQKGHGPKTVVEMNSMIVRCLILSKTFKKALESFGNSCSEGEYRTRHRHF